MRKLTFSYCSMRLGMPSIAAVILSALWKQSTRRTTNKVCHSHVIHVHKMNIKIQNIKKKKTWWTARTDLGGCALSYGPLLVSICESSSACPSWGPNHLHNHESRGIHYWSPRVTVMEVISNSRPSLGMNCPYVPSINACFRTRAATRGETSGRKYLNMQRHPTHIIYFIHGMWWNGMKSIQSERATPSHKQTGA